MEKTAIQRAVEIIELARSHEIDHDLRSIKFRIEKLESVFKQQIIDARISVTGLNHASPTDDNNLEDAEKYYNQNYTQ